MYAPTAAVFGGGTYTGTYVVELRGQSQPSLFAEGRATDVDAAADVTTVEVVNDVVTVVVEAVETILVLVMVWVEPRSTRQQASELDDQVVHPFEVTESNR